MRNRYGLIGFPLGHSFSKKYFTEKFNSENIDSEYHNYPLKDISELPVLLNNNHDIAGLNVTIPYKQQVIQYLDDITPEAQEIGAVNTIKASRVNGKLHLSGSNTDAPAFESELSDFTGDIPGNALILGTGGAAAAVSYVLNKLKWKFFFVSRNPSDERQINYEQIDGDLIKNTLLIINTTPLGMYPDITRFPRLPYNSLNNNHYLFDLIYNPEVTEFLKKGIQEGAKVRNGMGMLVKQAELAWETWQK